jgi:hypothetical protein
MHNLVWIWEICERLYALQSDGTNGAVLQSVFENSVPLVETPNENSMEVLYLKVCTFRGCLMIVAVRH